MAPTPRLRNKADIPLNFSGDYRHHALVATIRTEEPHGAVARRVFHGEGILAFLPLSDPQSVFHCLSLLRRMRSVCTERRRGV